MQSTEFILKHNYFNFGNQQFLQVKGTAMGTKMAPQYANIFMANLEENFLQNTDNKPLIYLRYIDDIFLLWTHGEEKLLQFYKDFNSEDPDIHVTMNHSTKEVNFLDTTIRLKNNTLQTSLYKKPTHSQTYLHPTSSHPPHIFASIIFSQALRYKRICSDKEELNSQLTTLKNAFTTLGYKPKTVKNQIIKAMSIPREALLKYQTKLESYRTPLVLTYHPYLRPINKIVKNLQPLLNKDPYLNQIFSVPPLISYRQPPNLKLLLTSASLPNERFITGTFPCNSPKCHLCPNINTNPTITGPNGVPIKISENFSCNSSNIIYAISCNLCPKAIYIGETSNTIRQRMNGHRSNIKHNRNKPVAKHFNKPDHSLDNLKLAVIKKVKDKTKQQWEVEEQKIIFKLDCVNQGLNKDYSFMSNYV